MGAPTEEEIMKLVGHRFPGGNRVIEHWENWLLTDCTGREQLPDELVHPVALFHVPIQGAGTSIAELCALGQVEGAGSVGLDSYDWQYFQPLREGIDYRFEGRSLLYHQHALGLAGCVLYPATRCSTIKMSPLPEP